MPDDEILSSFNSVRGKSATLGFRKHKGGQNDDRIAAAGKDADCLAEGYRPAHEHRTRKISDHGGKERADSASEIVTKPLPGRPNRGRKQFREERPHAA